MLTCFCHCLLPSIAIQTCQLICRYLHLCLILMKNCSFQNSPDLPGLQYLSLLSGSSRIDLASFGTCTCQSQTHHSHFIPLSVRRHIACHNNNSRIKVNRNSAAPASVGAAVVVLPRQEQRHKEAPVRASSPAPTGEPGTRCRCCRRSHPASI